MTIRPGKIEDALLIGRLHERAFGQRVEADLVDTLRRTCPDALSLVAAENDTLVGHVLFTPVVVEGAVRRVVGMGLGPMAVMPDRQRQGVGSRLVMEGLAVLRERRCPFVVVVGHPGYYPRFGFEPASRHGLSSQWKDVPDEAFMVLILDAYEMTGVSGVARYRDEFDDAAS